MSMAKGSRIPYRCTIRANVELVTRTCIGVIWPDAQLVVGGSANPGRVIEWVKFGRLSATRTRVAEGVADPNIIATQLLYSLLSNQSLPSLYKSFMNARLSMLGTVGKVVRKYPFRRPRISRLFLSYSESLDPL